MSAKQKDVVPVPPLTKNFLCRFFWLCETFFAIFLMSPKGPPSFFLFCKRMDVQKLPKGPLLHFSALYDVPETKKIRKKIKNGIFHFFPHAGTVEENT